MKIESIRILSPQLVLADPADVAALAARWWITFPDGYHDYVTRLGEGLLGGSFVRIYPPGRIEKDLTEWRRRIHKYWFWDAGRDVLPKERAIECIIIGDTVNGDELLFHPTRPVQLFVLPRDSEQVFDAGPDVLSAVEWMCASGKLVEPFAERDFEPFDSRANEANDAEPLAQVDLEGESLDDIVELAKRWAERHGAKKQARKDLKSQTGSGTKAELLYESFIIDGTFPHDSGYAIAWRVIDKTSGLEIGIFRWHKDDASHGSAYEPNQANAAKLRESTSK